MDCKFQAQGFMEVEDVDVSFDVTKPPDFFLIKEIQETRHDLLSSKRYDEKTLTVLAMGFPTNLFFGTAGMP